jgi:hypothetical protein
LGWFFVLANGYISHSGPTGNYLYLDFIQRIQVLFSVAKGKCMISVKSGVFLGLLAGGLLAGWAEAGSRPNIVFLMADDQSTYSVGCYGNRAVIGDWITLEPGAPKDMEVIIGEVPGGAFCSMLLVEVEGVEYERNRQNMPILPIFKTMEPSLDLIDAIGEHLTPDEASITGGPIFCDYASYSASGAENEEVEGETAKEPEPDSAEESTMRQWASTSGKTIDAEYLSLVGNNAILRNVKGKQLKIPVGQLSPEDQEYLELANPPRLNIDFIKRSSQRQVKVTPYLPEVPPRVFNYEFGVKVKQISSGAYNHELTVEYFALGQQYLDDQKYKLLDRNSDTFTLSATNNLSHRFSGKPVELTAYEFHGSNRGLKYAENLVVVTDKRGEIIQHSSSGKWIFEHLEELRALPVGAFLDDTGKRVHPTGPPSRNY